MPRDRGHQLANRIGLLLAGGYIRSNNLCWRRSSRAASLYDPAFAKNDGPIEPRHGKWPVGKASTARSAAISGASALPGKVSLLDGGALLHDQDSVETGGEAGTV